MKFFIINDNVLPYRWNISRAYLCMQKLLFHPQLNSRNCSLYGQIYNTRCTIALQAGIVLTPCTNPFYAKSIFRNTMWDNCSNQSSWYVQRMSNIPVIQTDDSAGNRYFVQHGNHYQTILYFIVYSKLISTSW